MADTNKLRPEVREAVEVMDARVSHATWQPIRAELLRLAWSGETFVLDAAPVWVRPIAAALSLAGMSP